MKLRKRQRWSPITPVCNVEDHREKPSEFFTAGTEKLRCILQCRSSHPDKLHATCSRCQDIPRRPRRRACRRHHRIRVRYRFPLHQHACRLGVRNTTCLSCSLESSLPEQALRTARSRPAARVFEQEMPISSRAAAHWSCGSSEGRQFHSSSSFSYRTSAHILYHRRSEDEQSPDQTQSGSVSCSQPM